MTQQHQTDQTPQIERKRGEKLSVFAPSEELTKKGAFVDINKRLPDAIIDYEAVESMLGEHAPHGMWVIPPDIVADIVDVDSGASFALLHGENQANEPVVAVMNDQFEFRQLPPGEVQRIPGTQIELTWLMHNQQVAVQPAAPDANVEISAFLMRD